MALALAGEDRPLPDCRNPAEPAPLPGKSVDHIEGVRRETRTQALILLGAAGVVVLAIGATVAAAWWLGR